MSDNHGAAHPGPVRDFVGYGPRPPDFEWPGGARVAINLVVNYEEGGEYSLNEYSPQVSLTPSSLREYSPPSS